MNCNSTSASLSVWFRERVCILFDETRFAFVVIKNIEFSTISLKMSFFFVCNIAKRKLSNAWDCSAARFFGDTWPRMIFEFQTNQPPARGSFYQNEQREKKSQPSMIYCYGSTRVATTFYPPETWRKKKKITNISRQNFFHPLAIIYDFSCVKMLHIYRWNGVKIKRGGNVIKCFFFAPFRNIQKFLCRHASFTHSQKCSQEVYDKNIFTRHLKHEMLKVSNFPKRHEAAKYDFAWDILACYKFSLDSRLN